MHWAKPTILSLRSDNPPFNFRIVPVDAWMHGSWLRKKEWTLHWFFSSIFFFFNIFGLKRNQPREREGVCISAIVDEIVAEWFTTHIMTDRHEKCHVNIELIDWSMEWNNSVSAFNGNNPAQAIRLCSVRLCRWHWRWPSIIAETTAKFFLKNVKLETRNGPVSIVRTTAAHLSGIHFLIACYWKINMSVRLSLWECNWIYHR